MNAVKNNFEGKMELLFKCKKDLLNWSLAIINLAVGRASESPTALEVLTANPYSCPASKSLKS